MPPEQRKGVRGKFQFRYFPALAALPRERGSSSMNEGENMKKSILGVRVRLIKEVV
jgi:hypothetical protein